MKGYRIRKLVILIAVFSLFIGNTLPVVAAEATDNEKSAISWKDSGKEQGMRHDVGDDCSQGENIAISTRRESPRLKGNSLQLDRKKLVLFVGEEETLVLYGTSKKAKWSSSDKSVAIVDSGGTVTATGLGTAKITARVGGKSVACKVTVRKLGAKKKLRKYLLENQWLKASDTLEAERMFMITYKSSKDAFVFEFSDDSVENSHLYIKMTLPRKNSATAKVTAELVEDGLYLKSSAKIDIKKYELGTNTDFKISPGSTSISEDMKEDYVALCNDALGYAFDFWDRLMEYMVGVRMHELGFDSLFL